MAIYRYKRGRTRTVTFNGTTTGDVKLGTDCKFYVPPDGGASWNFVEPLYFAPTEVRVSAGVVGIHHYLTQTTPSFGVIRWTHNLDITINDGSGGPPVLFHDEESHDFTFIVGGGTPPTNNWSTSMGGTWSVQIPLEEILEVEILSSYPDDGPSIRLARWYEQIPRGGVVTISATSGPLTLTGKTVTFSAPFSPIFYGVSINAICCSVGCDSQAGGSGIWTGSEGPKALGVPARSYSDMHRTFQASSGLLITTKADPPVPFFGSPGGYRCEGTLNSFVSQSYTLDLVVRGMEDSFPEGIDVEFTRNFVRPAPVIHVVGGAASDSYTQETYSSEGKLAHLWINTGTHLLDWRFEPNIPLIGKSEHDIALASVSQAWLRAHGENIEDRRVQFRGQRWDSFRLVQGKEYLVDSAFSGVG